MDRFKFRVWVDEAFPLYDFSGGHINIGWLDEQVSWMHLDFRDACIQWGMTEEMVPLDRGITIEQCTGLKDKNGKLIYEGDIVEYGGKEVYRHTVTQHNDGSFRITRPFGSVKTLLELEKYGWRAFQEHPIEVIGNIHENPEVLDVH